MSNKERVMIWILDAVDWGVNWIVRVILFFIMGISIFSLYDTYRVYDDASPGNLYSRYRPLSDGSDGLSFDELVRLNPDVIGWITLDDTAIDYPVVQGENNSQYLNRNALGEYSLSGSILMNTLKKVLPYGKTLFIRKNTDFSDPYSLLYGHHMDYDAMFGGLDHFTNEGYFDEHRSGELWISGSEYYDLTVVSCLVTDAYDEHVFRVTPEDNDLASLYDYLEDQSVFIADDLDKSEGKHLLGLSTCTNAGTNERTVIFCTINKLHEKEDIDETSD